MMLSTTLAMALLLQGGRERPPEDGAMPAERKSPAELKAELMAALSEKFKDVKRLEATATLTRAITHSSVEQEGTVTLKVSRTSIDEEHPPAVLVESNENASDGRIETIKSLITRKDAVVSYPRERLAYIYALRKQKNIPWEFFLLDGISSDLEKVFKIEVLKGPSADAAEPVDTGPKRDPKDGPAVGTDRGTKTMEGFGIGPLVENLWMVSLVPVDSALRHEITEFHVFLDPESLHPRYIHVTTPAEILKLTFTGHTFPDEFNPVEFEIDLDNYRVEKR